MSAPEDHKGSTRIAEEMDARTRSIDAQTRGLAQEAGLDRDLESQVPPLNGPFATRIIAALAVLAVLTLLWVLF